MSSRVAATKSQDERKEEQNEVHFELHGGTSLARAVANTVAGAPSSDACAVYAPDVTLPPPADEESRESALPLHLAECARRINDVADRVDAANAHRIDPRTGHAIARLYAGATHAVGFHRRDDDGPVPPTADPRTWRGNNTNLAHKAPTNHSLSRWRNSHRRAQRHGFVIVAAMADGGMHDDILAEDWVWALEAGLHAEHRRIQVLNDGVPLVSSTRRGGRARGAVCLLYVTWELNPAVAPLAVLHDTVTRTERKTAQDTVTRTEDDM